MQLLVKAHSLMGLLGKRETIMQHELDPVSLGGWKSQQPNLVGSELGVL